MMKIEIIPNNIAGNLCRKITEDLPEYFGIADANEHYALGVRERTNFAAKIADDYVALLSLDFPYPTNSNIYWMGVLREHQCQGIGQALIQSACAFAQAQEAKTMTVETLSPAESDEHYLKTYAFYKSCGFEPLLNLKPQGYEWNMVYMTKPLKTPLETLINIEKEFADFGFDWPHQEAIINQVISEAAEIKEALDHNESPKRIQEEIGDLIHAAISLCLFSGFDANKTLTTVNKKFSNRINAIKRLTHSRGLDNLQGKSTQFMLELWDEAKKQEEPL